MRGNAPRLIALVSLLCVGIAVYGYLRRGVEISALETKVEQLNASSAERVRKLQTELADEKKAQKTSELPPGNKDGGGAVSVAGSKPRNPGFSFDSMRKDPAYAWIWRKQQLRNIQRQYGDAIAAMKLSPDETAKLRNLLLERVNSQTDAREAAQQAGLSLEEVNQAVSQAQSEVNDEIKSLIGDDDYKQLLLPPSSMFKMLIGNTVGLDLEMAGSPLTPAQTTSLAQAYSEGVRNSGYGLFGGPNQTPDSETGLTPNSQALLDRMTPSLTPDQIPVIKDYLLEQLQQQQFIQKMNAANRGP
jgi:hypothetical protein